jgi:hypothetical protein
MGDRRDSKFAPENTLCKLPSIFISRFEVGVSVPGHLGIFREWMGRVFGRLEEGDMSKCIGEVRELRLWWDMV